jgi:hypothetical protein
MSLPSTISIDSLQSFFSPEHLASLLSADNLRHVFSPSTLKELLTNPASGESSNAVAVGASTLAALLIGRWAYRRMTEISLKDVRGPGDGEEGGSWLAGTSSSLFIYTLPPSYREC